MKYKCTSEIEAASLVRKLNNEARAWDRKSPPIAQLQRDNVVWVADTWLKFVNEG